jgi:hypothetical protein
MMEAHGRDMLNPWQRQGLTPVFQERFKLARVILFTVTVGGYLFPSPFPPQSAAQEIRPGIRNMTSPLAQVQYCRTSSFPDDLRT